jgi:hypothetical protein
MADAKKVVFPSTRFIQDQDENGHFIVDKKGEPVSGTFEVSLFEEVGTGAAVLVSKYSEKMSYKKFLAEREEIDPMTVAELQEHFPELQVAEADKEDKTVAPEPTVSAEEVAALKAQIEELKANQNAKTTAAKGKQASGKTDAGEPGTEDPSKEDSTAGKTEPTPVTE